MATTLAKTDVAPAEKIPQTAFVVAVNGKMLNLFTNVWITADPKKMEIDEYVQGQLDAGKLKIVTP